MSKVVQADTECGLDLLAKALNVYADHYKKRCGYSIMQDCVDYENMVKFQNAIRAFIRDASNAYCDYRDKECERDIAEFSTRYPWPPGPDDAVRVSTAN